MAPVASAAAGADAGPTRAFGVRKSGGALGYDKTTTRSRKASVAPLELGSAVVAQRPRDPAKRPAEAVPEPAPPRTTTRGTTVRRRTTVGRLSPVETPVVATAPTYSAEISEENPTAFALIADLSGSMRAPYGRGITRADAMADASNSTLSALVAQARNRRGVVRDVFHTVVLGAADLTAYDLLNGGHEATDDLLSFVPTSELAKMAEMIGDEAVWVEAQHRGRNGDVQAFDIAYRLLKKWTKAHPYAFPPTLMNVTDGYAVDGDPTPFAKKVRHLTTTDGRVLVYNIHIGNDAEPIIFPAETARLPNAEAHQLFRMSSVLPPPIREAARQAGFPVSEGSRGFAYNASLPILAEVMQVGSQIMQ